MLILKSLKKTKTREFRMKKKLLRVVNCLETEHERCVFLLIFLFLVSVEIRAAQTFRHTRCSKAFPLRTFKSSL